MPVMGEVWRHAAAPVFARRRIIDARLALTLRAAGVTNLATRNVKDFTDFGFDRVWDPFHWAGGVCQRSRSAKRNSRSTFRKCVLDLSTTHVFPLLVASSTPILLFQPPLKSKPYQRRHPDSPSLSLTLSAPKAPHPRIACSPAPRGCPCTLPASFRRPGGGVRWKQALPMAVMLAGSGLLTSQSMMRR